MKDKHDSEDHEDVLDEESEIDGFGVTYGDHLEDIKRD